MGQDAGDQDSTPHSGRAWVASITKFSLVGGTGIVVNSVALYLLYEIGHWPLLMASALAVELAIVNNFLLNNQWTFGARELSVSRFLRFNAVSLGGLAITTLVLYLLHEQGVHYLLANLAGIILATTWNFGLNVLWTWRWVE